MYVRMYHIYKSSSVTCVTYVCHYFSIIQSKYVPYIFTYNSYLHMHWLFNFFIATVYGTISYNIYIVAYRTENICLLVNVFLTALSLIHGF